MREKDFSPTRINVKSPKSDSQNSRLVEGGNSSFSLKEQSGTADNLNVNSRAATYGDDNAAGEDDGNFGFSTKIDEFDENIDDFFADDANQSVYGRSEYNNTTAESQSPTALSVSPSDSAKDYNRPSKPKELRSSSNDAYISDDERNLDSDTSPDKQNNKGLFASNHSSSAQDSPFEYLHSRRQQQGDDGDFLGNSDNDESTSRRRRQLQAAEVGDNDSIGRRSKGSKDNDSSLSGRRKVAADGGVDPLLERLGIDANVAGTIADNESLGQRRKESLSGDEGSRRSRRSRRKDSRSIQKSIKSDNSSLGSVQGGDNTSIGKKGDDTGTIRPQGQSRRSSNAADDASKGQRRADRSRENSVASSKEGGREQQVGGDVLSQGSRQKNGQTAAVQSLNSEESSYMRGNGNLEGGEEEEEDDEEDDDYDDEDDEDDDDDDDDGEEDDEEGDWTEDDDDEEGESDELQTHATTSIGSQMEGVPVGAAFAVAKARKNSPRSGDMS